MNILEYRAMKAEEAQVDSPKGEQPNVQAEQGATTNHEQTNPTPNEESHTSTNTGEQNQAQTNPGETEEITVVEVNGVDVPLDELANGYMRQSDYTRKTQELSRVRSQSEQAQKFYDTIMSNPETAQQISEQYGLPYVDPTQAQLVELTNKYQDLLLQQEVENLKAQYDDFDVPSVLQYAYDNKYENLEDAYLLLKSRESSNTQQQPIDVNTIKEQIRQELLAELQSNVDTGTIIQTGGDSAPVVDSTPTISQQELKVAQNLKMSPEEYIKWRDK